MEILFVSYYYWPPHFGGELLLSIERFQSLVERGHSVTVLTSGTPGFPREEQTQGVRILRSPIIHDSRIGRGFRRLLFPIWASRQMKKIGLDILHHGGTGGIEPVTKSMGMTLLNKTAHNLGAKTVFVHNLADTEKEMFSTVGFERKLRNKMLRQVDAIVSVSPALHEGVLDVFPDKAKLIINGIRDDLFVPLIEDERKNFRLESGISGEEMVFSFLGTVTKRKGFDLLIKAFIDLFKQYSNFRLWVIGPINRIENQNLDEEIPGLLDLSDQETKAIRFWGRINDRQKLAKIIGSSDVFVFPSRREGMGLAPLEAMATGVPVIVSRIPGVTDLANVEGETGLYINVEDLEGLKNAMISLGTDSKKRKEMGINARQRIFSGFGWQKHIEDWQVLYNGLNTNS
jgi:glycosyltransferase involved in cell wall biosynthesis